MAALDRADHERLVQALSYCILVHDAVTKNILWANDAACQMLGFTVEELKPLKAPDMSSPDVRYRRSVGVKWLQDAVDSGISRTEWMYRSKSGRNIMTEAIATRVDLSHGQAIMVQFRDIEKEESLKSDLQRLEGRLQAFLLRMAEGILVLDAKGTITFASGAATTQLNRGTENLLGENFLELCTASSRSALKKVLTTYRADDGASTAIRAEVTQPDGSNRWFGISCQYISLEKDLTGTMLMLQDITDQVAAEEQHRRDLEHLNYLGRYNAMGDMAMAIAHELGQPLAAATNFVDGVSRRVQGSDLNANDLLYGLKNARLQIERANQIVKSLRDFVVQLEHSEQIVDLNEIVRDCMYFVQLRADQSNTEVQLVMSEEPIWIRCEKVLTGQVVLNLCHNAIDEMSGWPERERHITITTYATSEAGVFRIADRGKGISHIPDGRIFDGAFTSKATGSGIGLALSHRIITRQHGHIYAEENESRGASFTFELPLTEIEDVLPK
ncbi:PAS domain S-box protein [Paenarthrobacter sp. YIM B13468]|uniref:PAS domain S-box protein n=1 Tax=Paenarthrobacter sp. YIM B13468 TaxID=3366295 RepID=UPI00366EB465